MQRSGAMGDITSTLTVRSLTAHKPPQNVNQWTRSAPSRHPVGCPKREPERRCPHVAATDPQPLGSAPHRYRFARRRLTPSSGATTAERVAVCRVASTRVPSHLAAMSHHRVSPSRHHVITFHHHVSTTRLNDTSQNDRSTPMFSHPSPVMHQLVRDRHDHIRRARDRGRLRRPPPPADDHSVHRHHHE